MVSTTLQEAIEQPILYARWVAYLDFFGDPLRATTGLYPKTFTSTGDAELDGFTFDVIDTSLVRISDVEQNESGSSTVTAALSGLIINELPKYLFARDGYVIQDRFGEIISLRDNPLLEIIGDKTRWQGRLAKLWWYVVDENENQIGEVYNYYTGYMSDVNIIGNPQEQTVVVSIEHYMSILSGTSNKTYMMQAEFDPNDTSANATLAAANGVTGSGVQSGSGSGGSDNFFNQPRTQER